MAEKPSSKGLWVTLGVVIPVLVGIVGFTNDSWDLWGKITGRDTKKVVSLEPGFVSTRTEGAVTFYVFSTEGHFQGLKGESCTFEGEWRGMDGQLFTVMPTFGSNLVSPTTTDWQTTITVSLWEPQGVGAHGEFQIETTVDCDGVKDSVRSSSFTIQ